MLTKKIEELKDTQNRLIQSEKLAATGELTAGLCHEINNPISIILNPHSTLKCNKRRSDFNWCFKTQALLGRLLIKDSI